MAMCQGWGLWQEFVSAFPVSMWLFSHLPNVRHHSASFCISEGIALCIHQRREIQELPQLPSWSICYCFMYFNPLYLLSLLNLKLSQVWPMEDSPYWLLSPFDIILVCLIALLLSGIPGCSPDSSCIFQTS